MDCRGNPADPQRPGAGGQHRLVSERLTVFGLAMDAARNQQPNSAGERLISADGSRVRCAVIPTNEERMIALDAIRLGRIHTAAALA
ncbi:hypothetical protein BXT92_08840 [Klebsiella pneumoniae]|nr:hypothetical protein BXT92_08840 [Klebsiella pneumoniae]